MQSSTLPKRAALTKLVDKMRHPSGRLLILLVLHTVLFFGIYALSYSARYDFSLPKRALSTMLLTAPLVLTLKLLIFYFASHFHGWWRYVTFADIKSLLQASFISMMAIGFADYFFSYNVSQIPRAVILIDTLLTIIVVGGLRCVWRFADEHLGTQFKSVQVEPALLIGTDHRSGILASHINANQAMPFRIRGFVSLTANPRKQVFAGISVAGSVDQIPAISARYGAKHVFLPCDLLSGAGLRELIKTCNKNDLIVRVLPRLEDTLAGSQEIPLREVNIDDLLKRDPVRLHKEGLASFLKGKRVLVTGAGGSIGSEICRQLIEFNPSEILLLGRGENRIYTINRDLSATAKQCGIVLNPIIADITDEESLRNAFEQHRPDIVFHAAAHKHVPLMELHVREALRNNVIGTHTVTKLADEYGCSHFVMVSTDKAVNPTSVMGATKNIAERVVYSASQTSETKFCVVRFGNVLGSAGSVIPLFQKQIRAGGPITVTHPDMTRYFMSIPEASQLVMQAGSMASGGEIFVLDMGEPVSIVRLAEDLIELSGLAPGSIEVIYSGIRKGEKLYEELYFDDEELIKTSHEKVRAAYHRPFTTHSSDQEVERIQDSLGQSNGVLRSLIQELVPEYQDEMEPQRVSG